MTKPKIIEVDPIEIREWASPLRADNSPIEKSYAVIKRGVVVRTFDRSTMQETYALFDFPANREWETPGGSYEHPKLGRRLGTVVFRGGRTVRFVKWLDTYELGD